MSKDLLLFESGSGGDLLVSNNDLNLVESLYQQVYLALFGGNIESDTTGQELETQIREDWWGNEIFNDNKIKKQFNSITERTLDSVTLNTSGRIDIVRAVEEDLKVLENIADFSIKVIILSTDRVKIEIQLIQPDEFQEKSFQFIWDNATGEVIKEIII